MFTLIQTIGEAELSYCDEFSLYRARIDAGVDDYQEFYSEDRDDAANVARLMVDARNGAVEVYEYF